MSPRSCISLSALLLATGATALHAAEPVRDTAFYMGATMGASNYSLASASTPASLSGAKRDTHGTAFKLYGGYRLTEHFGAELGYAHLGRANQWTTVNGTAMRDEGKGRAFYAAATAQLPLGDAFAVHGRLGVARGKVSGGGTRVPLTQGLAGSATGAIVGIGAEYKLTPTMSLTADYDHFTKLSRQAKGGMLTVGLRANF